MATYKAVHNRKDKLLPNGTALVQIEAYQTGKRRYFSTSVRVSPKEWDEKRGEVKSNGFATRKIRAKINELEAFEVAFPETHSRAFTLDDFDLLFPKKSVSPVHAPKKATTFSDYLRGQIELDKTKVRTTSAYARKLRVATRLDAYSKEPVGFDGLTYPFIIGFDQALRNTHHLHDNTIYKEHQILREYLVRAIKSGLIPITGNPYDQFRPKKKAVDKDVFTANEIQRIENLTFNPDNQYLAFYRDAFLLAYYTLLRVSDLVSLRRIHVQETDDGLMLNKAQQKTERTVSIPLHKLHRLPDQATSKPEQLLKKYWPADDKAPFFDRSEVKMQMYVKSVFRLAGIRREKPLAFSYARHSGITNLCKVLPVPFVQKLAGHRKIETTMQYLHLTNLDLQEGLDKVNW